MDFEREYTVELTYRGWETLTVRARNKTDAAAIAEERLLDRLHPAFDAEVTRADVEAAPDPPGWAPM